MNQLQKNRFARLREMVAQEIERQLAIDCCCKSYEGTWELTISYPNYFEDETATAKPDFYQITLHCYVIGPNRHYDWSGKSWDECLNKAELDIDEWCAVEVDNGASTLPVLRSEDGFGGGSMSVEVRNDPVNSPSHYTSGEIECIDAIEAATQGLTGIEAVCTGNAIKYLWRWKLKNGSEDLQKARWYIDHLIELLGGTT